MLLTKELKVKLLSRVKFKEEVFARDKSKCVICKKDAVDAHHIIERKLFSNGGYYIDNGVSVCAVCHLLAEQTILSCEQLRKASNIKVRILPTHFSPNLEYDKWGNIVLSSGKRVAGELYRSEQVQKILPKEIKVLFEV